LGNVQAGDGSRYRGRGLIQLTGRANYTAFSKDSGIDAVNHPDVLGSMEGAIKAACWFWRKHELNRFVDRDDFRGLTRAINGGYNGLDDRLDRLGKLERA
jgi:putative chitinase